MARNGNVKNAGTATVPPPDEAPVVIPPGPEPVVLQMPVDVRSVALSILAGAATIM